MWLLTATNKRANMAKYSSTAPLAYNISPFPKRQILDSPKLKEFEDDKFEFDENGKKSSKRVENAVGEREIACKAMSPFPTVFSKDLFYGHIKTKDCLGKGQKCTIMCTG